MKKWDRTLIKIARAALCVMPAILFFSYYPVIKLGASDSMNFELSLPIIWLVIFTIINLLLLPRLLKRANLKIWQIILLALFPLYVIISLFWSANFSRGLLTAGVFGCMTFSIFAIVFLPITQKTRQKILQVFLISSAAVAAFCWIQSILDAAGIPTTHTLACRGCTTNTFGFPHPNGFAIEPQFMGNLLLAPAILAIYLTIHSSDSLRTRAKFFALAFFLSTTLFFTFSRGAIYAFVVASIVIFVFEFVRYRRTVIYLPIILLSALLTCLLAQGTFAAVSPTSDTFWSGITKSIHQLSLGKIDLRPNPIKTVVENTTIKTETVVQITPASVDPEPAITAAPTVQPSFDGYVAESTNTRLSLTSASLKTWSQSPTTILAGVGVGGAGVAMYQAGQTDSPKEITQNEYTEILLELGLIGTAALIISAATFIQIIIKRLSFKSPATVYLLALILAYLLTMIFFSGLPNVLHIYLLPPLALRFFQKKI